MEWIESLLTYYEKNARDLPWRRTRDPYRIWISEIMLQQTRVEAVRGYYARFLEALPDVSALAAIPEDRLLKLWEGLGYYSRARNLKKAANIIVEQHGGQLPADYDIYDVLDVVMNALGDSENSVYDFTKPLAASVKWTPSGKSSIASDVLAYYIYALVNSFEGCELPAIDKTPTVRVAYGTNGQQMLDKWRKIEGFITEKMEDEGYIDSMMAAARENINRGSMTNYSILSLESSGIDLNKIAKELFDTIDRKKYLTADDKARAESEVIPDLENYVAHKYYMTVLNRLGAVTQPKFNVSEVYTETLYGSTATMKDLLYYFTTLKAEMDADEIDNVMNSTFSSVVGEEEEEETSRYLSDDGRIVSVTYGTKNADGSYSAYKTFILNYNNFSVNVEYNDVTYTIPAYGYVVVMH